MGVLLVTVLTVADDPVLQVTKCYGNYTMFVVCFKKGVDKPAGESISVTLSAQVA